MSLKDSSFEPKPVQLVACWLSVDAGDCEWKLSEGTDSRHRAVTLPHAILPSQTPVLFSVLSLVHLTLLVLLGKSVGELRL